MDVVHVTRKQTQQVSRLEVLMSRKRVKEPPRVYNSITVEYKIKGKDIEENAVQRAIQLSEDKHCSVGAMLRAKARLTRNYIIRGE